MWSPHLHFKEWDLTLCSGTAWSTLRMTQVRSECPGLIGRFREQNSWNGRCDVFPWCSEAPAAFASRTFGGRATPVTERGRTVSRSWDQEKQKESFLFLRSVLLLARILRLRIVRGLSCSLNSSLEYLSEFWAVIHVRPTRGYLPHDEGRRMSKFD